MDDLESDFSLLLNRLARKQQGIALVEVETSGVLTDCLSELSQRLPERTIISVGYDPAVPDATEGSPWKLVEQCHKVEGDAAAIINVHPQPLLSEATDQQRIDFWKQLNFQRERLGQVSAQVLLWVDAYNSPFAYHYSRDLLDWCSPKFHLKAPPLAYRDRLPDIYASLEQSEFFPDTPRHAQIVWDSLYPLFEAAPQPLSEEDIEQILLPLSKAASALGKLDDLQQFVTIGEKYLPEDSPLRAPLYSNLAQLLYVTNRLAEAEPLMRRALEISEAAYGPEHPDVAIRLNNLARLLQATNRLAEAEPLMRRALEIFARFHVSTGHEHPGWQVVKGNYARLLGEMGRDEAEIEAAVKAVIAEARG